MYYIVPLTVILIRLFIPLLIFKKPFWGALLAMAADASDIIIMDAFGWGFLEGKPYHVIDKVFDTYYLAIEFYVSLSWQIAQLRRTSMVLFIWRLLGVIVFSVTQIRQVVFFAPNIFENFYLLVVGLHKFFPKFQIKTTKRLVIVLAIATVPKLIQEYIMHFLEFHTWHFIKHNIFRWH